MNIHFLYLAWADRKHSQIRSGTIEFVTGLSMSFQCIYSASASIDLLFPDFFRCMDRPVFVNLQMLWDRSEILVFLGQT